jgi:hypothetical protein
MLKINFPWRSVANYTFASIVTGIVLFLLPGSSSILMTLIWTATGGLLYLVILVLIDKEPSMPKQILGEVRGKKSSSADGELEAKAEAQQNTVQFFFILYASEDGFPLE